VAQDHVTGIELGVLEENASVQALSSELLKILHVAVSQQPGLPLSILKVVKLELLIECKRCYLRRNTFEIHEGSSVNKAFQF
jgi:hypothetical protein